jgi:hypothetical protein
MPKQPHKPDRFMLMQAEVDQARAQSSAAALMDARRMEIAKQYVDKQLQTMKQCGSAPKDMSEQEYKALVKKIAEGLRC